MKITDALERYALQLDADGRSSHTIAQARRHVGLFAIWAHNPWVRDVGHEELARFLVSDTARLRPDGQSKKATSMNGVRSSIKTFFGWCAAAGVTERDPARLVRRARCGDPPPRALSEDDQERLIAALAAAQGEAAERDHGIFGLMLATGIRLGSAVGLDIEDVDLVAGEILLRHCKGDRTEVAFLPPAARDVLAGVVAGRTSGPVFRSRHGRRISARQAARRFALACERAGIGRRGTHVMRHTYATTLYEKTRDVLVVQAALHHRSLLSTTRYARPSTRQLKAALGLYAG